MIIQKKLGYLASKKDVITRTNGVEVNVYNTPFDFRELYMPLSDDEQLSTQGLDKSRVLRMFVCKSKWYGKIHVDDRAYLIDESTDENDITEMAKSANQFCTNANYRVSVVAVQNFKLKVEFVKIGEGDYPNGK